MNELEAAGAVAAGLKPAVDLAKSLLDLLGPGKGREQAIELYGKIAAAQASAIAANAAQAMLIDEKRELEARLTRFERWDSEKDRYELKDVGGGVLAYAVKPSAQGAEPAHSLCPRCYQHREKSILQPESRSPGRTHHLVCHECGSDFVTTGMRYVATPSPS